MNVILKGLGAVGIYLVKKYAASIIFDIVVEAAGKAAKKTDTQIDDEVVAKVKADKAAIIAFF